MDKSHQDQVVEAATADLKSIIPNIDSLSRCIYRAAYNEAKRDTVERNVELINTLRMYADDLHSYGGYNGYASAMSLAADALENRK